MAAAIEDIVVGYGVSVRMSFGSTEAAFRSTDDATGTMRWHASVLLGALLAKTRVCTGTAVTELGCGASLPSVVAVATGARSVLVTDAFAAAVALGLSNVSRLAPASCTISSAILEWSDISAAERLLPKAGVVLSSENLYVHRAAAAGQGGEESVLREQATALFSCARHVLAPGGIVLGVYSPRYRGMAASVAAGAAAAGLAFCRIESSGVLTEDLARSLRFGRTRLFAAASEAASLAAFLSKHGLAAGPPVAHESDSEEEEDGGGQGRVQADLFE